MTASKKYTDFNDLHELRGLPVVREQLMAALKHYQPKSPTPPNPAEQEPKSEGLQQEKTDNNQPFSIEMMLQRFALVIGETKVWDSCLKMAMKKQAFKDLVGKDLSVQWLEHPSKRKISIENVKSAQAEASASSVGVAGVEEMLRRYVLIYGTKDVWDKQTRARLPAETLKLAWPNEYELWLKNPTKRKMVMPDQIIFDPTMQVGDECINTFDGLPLTPSDKAECFTKSYGIQRLLRFMCESEDVYQWALRWLALPLQKPGTKLATAIMFHGEVQGAGKSLFFSDIHRMLYGKYSATLNQHQLESQYSDWKSNNLYSVFEEIFSSSGKYQNMGLVKGQITNKTQRIEKKFVSGWEEANYSNAVFLSNEMQPLPIEPNDRRFLICWPKQQLPADILAHALDNFNQPDNEGIRAWYAFLLQLSMTWTDSQGVEQVFHAHSYPPMTEAKQRLIEYGLPAWEVFYRDWKSGRLPYPYMSCRSQDLYDAYRRYCMRSGEKPLTMTKFNTLISVRERKSLGWYLQGQVRKQATIFYVGQQPKDITEIKWLTDCIEEFERTLNANNG